MFGYRRKFRNLHPIVSGLETIYVVIDRPVPHNVIGSVEFTTTDDPDRSQLDRSTLLLGML